MKEQVRHKNRHATRQTIMCNKPVVAKSRQMQDRFSERFRWNRTRVNTDSTDLFLFIDDRHRLSHLHGLDRTLEGGRTTSNHDQIILFNSLCGHGHAWLTYTSREYPFGYNEVRRPSQYVQFQHRRLG